MKRITLQSVADIAGVSRMTASRALRDDPKVAATTKQRVERAAKKLGYTPDIRLSNVMRAIRSGREITYRETIAFILTHPSWLAQEDRLAANEAALALGYNMECIQAWDYPSELSLAKMLKARGIRGLILAPNKVKTHFAFGKHFEGFSCILLGSSLDNTGLSRVRPAYFKSAMHCMAEIRKLRYQRVALLVDRSLNKRTGMAYSGAFAAFQIDAQPGSFAKRLYLREADDTSWHKWIRQSAPGLLIIQSNRDFNEAKTAMLSYCPQPAIVSLNVGSNDFLTGIRYPYQLLAQQAVRTLSEQLNAGQFEQSDQSPIISIPGKWQSGQTAPPQL